MPSAPRLPQTTTSPEATVHDSPSNAGVRPLHPTTPCAILGRHFGGKRNYECTAPPCAASATHPPQEGKLGTPRAPTRLSVGGSPRIFAPCADLRYSLAAAACETHRPATTCGILVQLLPEIPLAPRRHARFSGSGCPKLLAHRGDLRDSRADSPHLDSAATRAFLGQLLPGNVRAPSRPARFLGSCRRPVPALRGNLRDSRTGAARVENASAPLPFARFSGRGCPRIAAHRDNARTGAFCAITAAEKDRVPRQQATAQQLPGPPATCVILGKWLQGKPLVQGEPARFSSSACPGMFALRGNAPDSRAAAAPESPHPGATCAILGQRLSEIPLTPPRPLRFSGQRRGYRKARVNSGRGRRTITAHSGDPRESRAAAAREPSLPATTRAVLGQLLPDNPRPSRQPARFSGSDCGRSPAHRGNQRDGRAAAARNTARRAATASRANLQLPERATALYNLRGCRAAAARDSGGTAG